MASANMVPSSLPPVPVADVETHNGHNGVNGTNGTNGTPKRPSTPLRTPSFSGFSLTEYSAVSPPSERNNIKIKKLVPDEFLLPNGYPDVGALPMFLSLILVPRCISNPVLYAILHVCREGVRYRNCPSKK